MIPGTPPANEAGRLDALSQYDILDTPDEQVYNDFTLLAAQICGAPIALISLIDSERQWFKSRVGLEVAETPRDLAFCAHAISTNELLVVPDATRDSRFHDNPLVVGEPNIKFYAGAPLVTDQGFGLGTLCVIDRVPRKLSDKQLGALQALSRQLMARLDLRRTLKALAFEQQFAQGMMDSSLEGLLVIHPDGTILRANPAIVNLFGIPAADIVGRPIEEMLANPNPYRVAGTARASLADAIGRLTEWEGRRADGEVVPCQVLVWVFGPPGRRSLACHVRDLTKQREAERVKKRFVANVSHELRTPLTSIRGALALVVDAEESLTDESRELLSAARRNTERLLVLVNDLLDLERVGSGQLSIEKRRCSLAAVIDRAVDTVRPIAADAAVSLTTAPTSVQLDADPDRLAQVITNLMANAVRYSPPGGTVTVGVSELATGVRVTVEDQGPGVPEKFRSVIFEPFKQVEGSADHRKGGTGLGLAISNAIVKEHDGVLGVGDAPGGGARFWLDLPVEPGPSQPPASNGV